MRSRASTGILAQTARAFELRYKSGILAGLPRGSPPQAVQTHSRTPRPASPAGPVEAPQATQSRVVPCSGTASNTFLSAPALYFKMAAKLEIAWS